MRQLSFQICRQLSFQSSDYCQTNVCYWHFSDIPSALTNVRYWGESGHGVDVMRRLLLFRTKPGVIVVITDGEETCRRSPCELGKQLRAEGYKLTVHAVAFRYEGYSWTGGSSVMDLMCVAEQTGGLYVKANSEEELVEALEKTLDCPMTSEAPLSFGAISSNAE
jgi:hypothetical protein